MGKVVPLAASMNTTQEELFGTMATLTGVTGDTAEVSTQLASIYSAFMKPTEKLTKIAKKHGYESGVAMLKEKGLAESIKVLSKETDGNETKLAKLLKRKEALVAVLALAGGQADTYEQKLAALRDTTGSTDEAFKAQTTGINAQGQAWKKATQLADVFSQKLGDSLAPALSNVVDLLTGALEAVTGISQIEKEKKESAEDEEAFIAKTKVSKTGTLSEKQVLLAKLQERQNKLRKSSKSAGNVSFGEFLDKITGGEDAVAKKKRRHAENQAGINALEKSIFSDEFGELLSGKRKQVGFTPISQPKPQQSTVNQNITMNVVGVTNPDAVADKVAKKLSAEINRGKRTVGAAQQ
jgi:hypothetical protein